MVYMFHSMSLSLWPLVMSLSVLLSFISLFLSMKVSVNFLSMFSVMVVLSWFKDVGREGDWVGEHSTMNNFFFKMGMILFISSEVMFFFSFFWCYFDFVFVVDHELGGVWPSKGIHSVNPFGVPLLNTIILLSSGLTITWSHFSILMDNWLGSLVVLVGTLVLGVYFLVVQWYEYQDVSFNFMSSGYGSIFFLATGFHGFHVVLGCMLILGNSYRLTMGLYDSMSHWNFEFVSWYWHFVDVVWLFLYIFIYWWGY